MFPDQGAPERELALRERALVAIAVVVQVKRSLK